MKHILIAEDQQSARFVLTFQLKKAGFKVTAVENGALALKTIQENLNTEDKIDLLVTDIEMPEMSGLDLYKSVSELKINIPIIVIIGAIFKYALKFTSGICPENLIKKEKCIAIFISIASIIT